MTIRFAAARPGASATLARALIAPTPRGPANDNASDLTRNGLLRAALRHFAQHGLGAAEIAQRNAERAFFSGDAKEYRHWLDICRALDRRMADAVAARQTNTVRKA